MARAKKGDALVLTVKEVAEVLRIHRPKVYELIKCGALQGIKIGSDWRVKRASVEELIGPIPDTFFSAEKDLGIKSKAA